MSVELNVLCDGRLCYSEQMFYEPELNERDLKRKGWRFDYENCLYYCPKCVPKMIASGDLESDEDEPDES